MDDVLAAQHSAARIAAQRASALQRAVVAHTAAAPEVVDVDLLEEMPQQEEEEQQQQEEEEEKEAAKQGKSGGSKAPRRRRKAAPTDSDSDYKPEDEAAAVAADEQRWVEEQRQLRGQSGSHGDEDSGEEAGVAGGAQGRRRRGGAAPVQAPARVKRDKAAPGGDGSGVSDDMAALAGRLEAGARVIPRTKASPAAAGGGASLRLSFRAAEGGQRLAVVTLRSGAPLQRAMQEVAARCLDGGSAELASALTFRLGSRVLAPEATPRSAGLQDGDTVLVGF